MIVRHIVEISEYLSRATTFNSANTKLVTLAPGLRPERRFAPLARGLVENVPDIEEILLGIEPEHSRGIRQGV